VTTLCPAVQAVAVLWVGVGLGIVIIFAVPAVLERYVAHRGIADIERGSWLPPAACSLGGGFAMLFATPMSGPGCPRRRCRCQHLLSSLVPTP
jgi:hypothetical protein